MAASLNKVQLIGNIGRDPDIRFSQDGSKIITLSLATSEFWRDKSSGERKEKTEWHRVVVFNERLCDVIEKYVRKGSRLYIEGQLQTRKWTDAQNNERYTTEIVLSRFNGELLLMDNKGPQDAPSPYTQNDSSSLLTPKNPSEKCFLDDDIPF